MPQWDNKFVGYSYLLNKTLQQAIENEKNNKNRQQPKIQKKSARRKCRSNLNHEFFSEIFIDNPFTLFSKLMGTISIRIML